MIYGNVFADGHRNNSLFMLDDNVHRYNPTYTPRLLREAFLKQGIEINTPDINQGRSVAFDLHMEGRALAESNVPQYLIAMENPYHNRMNADRDYCRLFCKVFAWDKRLCDLPNVVPVMVPQRLRFDSFPAFEQRDIFSCLINANKAFREKFPSDLYRERINTIRWYEKHASDKFELYGMGWDKPTPAFDFIGKAKRSVASLKTKLFNYKPYPNYRGEVHDKHSILRRSKFSYCYENTRGPDNYITEKIFDSFLSGCVPIYWGAENILDYIPSDCFIDRQNFEGTAAVHQFLLAISHEEYGKYQSNIERFLKSDMAQIFSSEYFVSTIIQNITQNIS